MEELFLLFIFDDMVFEPAFGGEVDLQRKLGGRYDMHPEET